MKKMRLAAVIRFLFAVSFQIFISVAPIETEIKKEYASGSDNQTLIEYNPDILEKDIDLFSYNGFPGIGNTYNHLPQENRIHAFFNTTLFDTSGFHAKLLNCADLSPPTVS